MGGHSQRSSHGTPPLILKNGCWLPVAELTSPCLTFSSLLLSLLHCNHPPHVFTLSVSVSVDLPVPFFLVAVVFNRLRVLSKSLLPKSYPSIVLKKLSVFSLSARRWDLLRPHSRSSSPQNVVVFYSPHVVIFFLSGNTKGDLRQNVQACFQQRKLFILQGKWMI